MSPSSSNEKDTTSLTPPQSNTPFAAAVAGLIAMVEPLGEVPVGGKVNVAWPATASTS